MRETTAAKSVRKSLIKWVFSPSAGVVYPDWSQALKKYGKTIPPWYWPRTAFTTVMSLMNSVLRVCEKKYKDNVTSQEVKAPIFIIGHHRSGTTHLWRLLAHDKRFVFPEVTETIFPKTMLTFKKTAHFLAERFIPRARPQDNVKQTADAPLDKEWGLCTSTFLSTIADCQTNSYPALQADKKRKIAAAWQPCFEAFGYPTDVKASGKPLLK